MDLFYDYRTNVASYPAWQEWLRRHQPPLLVLWGRFDPSFQVEEAEAYRRDVPSAEVHILDAGHFALDEQPDTVGAPDPEVPLVCPQLDRAAFRAPRPDC